MAFFASYLRHLLGLLDIRAEIVASPSQDNIQKLSRMDEDTLLVALTAGRAHPLIHAGPEARPSPPRPDARRSPTRRSPTSPSTPS